jgi:hypothetical protein
MTAPDRIADLLRPGEPITREALHAALFPEIPWSETRHRTLQKLVSIARTRIGGGMLISYVPKVGYVAHHFGTRPAGLKGRHVYRGKIDTEARGMVERACLCCRKPFDSHGPQNRLCRQCSTVSVSPWAGADGDTGRRTGARRP